MEKQKDHKIPHSKSEVNRFSQPGVIDNTQTLDPK